MSFPDLPTVVKSMLADESLRTHHHLWHFVRNPDGWNGLPQADREALAVEGWKAPRFEDEAGSGIDFLGMHREMIEMTDRALATANDPNWPSVTGWDPIPWTDDDADWPVPAWQTTAPPWASAELWQGLTDVAVEARSAAQTAVMEQLAARFRDTDFLSSVSLDELGIAMEGSIHGWMHIRWSAAPHDDAFSVDASNDWLFVPWSSHVSKTFWKLHGWIDARITDWEAATGQAADLSQTWAGPAGVPGAMPHTAEVRLLAHLPPREEVPLPMVVRRHVVEALLQ